MVNLHTLVHIALRNLVRFADRHLEINRNRRRCACRAGLWQLYWPHLRSVVSRGSRFRGVGWGFLSVRLCVTVAGAVIVWFFHR